MTPQRQAKRLDNPTPRMNRGEQIEFMEGVEARNSEYARRWFSDPVFRQSLHRYDLKRADSKACACQEAGL